MVKFTQGEGSGIPCDNNYGTYSRVIREGILVGLRKYGFFGMLFDLFLKCFTSLATIEIILLCRFLDWFHNSNDLFMLQSSGRHMHACMCMWSIIAIS